MSTPAQDSVINQPRGAQIIQTNQLSTPVMIALLVAFFLAAAIGAGALGVAYNAAYASQMAERNAKLAQYQVELALKDAGLPVPRAKENDL